MALKHLLESCPQLWPRAGGQGRPGLTGRPRDDTTVVSRYHRCFTHTLPVSSDSGVTAAADSDPLGHTAAKADASHLNDATTG